MTLHNEQISPFQNYYETLQLIKKVKLRLQKHFLIIIISIKFNAKRKQVL